MFCKSTMFCKPTNLMLALFLLMTPAAFAAQNPDDQTIALYYQAAQGDDDETEKAYQALTTHVEEKGSTPLSMIFIGATQTLQGRDAFLPWNKMKYVEQGIASIDKGLALIDADPDNENNRETVMGLPGQVLAQANAATVFTELPDMFNQFDKGYEIYLDLFADNQLQLLPFEATSWIYRYAIQAALKTGERQQAELWFNEMEQLGSNHADTLAVRKLLSDNG
ncbi:hypothetical protein MACH09_10520 [Vibrio sp. MACH09]|uniref:hypothetical protein n=1 Tax=Vibrio sp. MACH09 TaxID=3025122 RepID=UPI0027912E6A|nr:hypothetical protein [Vibrio sp. MACH09]GLO60544.1 hypothetical protein MACH09_10520 [Vibrio sp. MACH09]